jgi:hypothetical protein
MNTGLRVGDAFELTDRFECFLKLAIAFRREFSFGRGLSDAWKHYYKVSEWCYEILGHLALFYLRDDSFTSQIGCPRGIEEPVYAMVFF